MNQFVINQQAPVANGDRVLTVLPGVEAALGLRMDITILTQGAITGTVQWYLQDSEDGQTWDDVIASNTFAFGAALTTQRFSIALAIASGITQGSAVSNLAAAPPFARPGPLGSKLRLVERVTAIAGSPTGPTYRIALTAK